MKRKHIFLLLGTLLILMGLVVCLLFVFMGLYGSSQSSDTPVTTAPKEDIELFVIDSWHFRDCTWDDEGKTLTAIRTFDLTYEDAKKIGSRVFAGDLAPETYLSQAVTIETDLRSRFSVEDLTVVLSFRGSDGAELFSVDSRGNIATCWSTES